MTSVNQITFRPAVRENVGLWINLIGGTGSGKTFTAMRLASGICGDKPFALIDTENRRGLHYADMFKFDHAELSPPFRPDAYAEAVLAADAAGYPVIVIDSGSHVWNGDGGVLDWQEEELKRLGGGDNVKMLSWVKPKTAHKRMMSKFLQVKAHIILCLRAEEKIEMVRVNGKTEIRAKQSMTGLDGWIPLCEKSLPFEATVSFLLMANKPGMPHPIKLQEQHKSLFPLDRPITEESGKLLAAWAAGGEAKKADDLETKRSAMIDYFGEMGISAERVCSAVGKTTVDDIGTVEIAALKSIATDIKTNDLSLIDAFPIADADPADYTSPEVGAEPPEDVDEPETELDSDLENLRAACDERVSKFAASHQKTLTGGKKVSAMSEGELILLRDRLDAETPA